MKGESRYAQAMRLAARRLDKHAEISNLKADRLEYPSGFGEDVDKTRRQMAVALRRDSAEDRVRGDELRALRRTV